MHPRTHYAKKQGSVSPKRALPASTAHHYLVCAPENVALHKTCAAGNVGLGDALLVVRLQYTLSFWSWSMVAVSSMTSCCRRWRSRSILEFKFEFSRLGVLRVRFPNRYPGPGYGSALTQRMPFIPISLSFLSLSFLPFSRITEKCKEAGETLRDCEKKLTHGRKPLAIDRSKLIIDR